MDNVWVGTSGWTYADWAGAFYPRDVAKKRWLDWYATQFGTTEINASFYRTPSEAAVESWRDGTPDGFLFAWKASKFITHWKRLGPSSASSISLMETRLRLLGPKLGPVLFQLPQRFEADLGRLRDFVELLPREYTYAFEFRQASWYAPACLDLLRERDIALCISDHHQAPAPWLATARHVYVRGHGPRGDYKGHYSDEALRDWTGRIRRWAGEGHRVFVYFDNDQKSAAPADARRLLAFLSSKRRAARRTALERGPRSRVS